MASLSASIACSVTCAPGDPRLSGVVFVGNRGFVHAEEVSQFIQGGGAPGVRVCHHEGGAAPSPFAHGHLGVKITPYEVPALSGENKECTCQLQVIIQVVTPHDGSRSEEHTSELQSPLN